MVQITLRDYMQEIEDAISTGRLDEAFEKCQRLLTQFPEALEVQRLLGEVYLAQGQMKYAQQFFDWVLTNDPENVVVYCDRALISERTSDFDTALDCYQQAYELSRGNSQIRQQFNQLSVKVGQQGFMLSRAGLARIYMRGDLLPQAIQEWESVLTLSPSRLDARTGLLETYWREGMYDQVEQIATNILRDVPGCLKALLLFAYVTSTKNMQQAQELVQRAEALDPDRLMAKELFEKTIATQPDHPFLRLLQKAPVALNIPPVAVPTHNGQEALDPISQWSDIDVWNTRDTFTPPQQYAAEVPTFLSWPDTTNIPETQQAQQDVHNGYEHADLPTFQDVKMMHETFQEEPPAQQQLPQEPLFESFKWDEGNTLTEAVNTWAISPTEDVTASPPAWLSMLTQEDQWQPSEALPVQQPPARDLYASQPLAEKPMIPQPPPTQLVPEHDDTPQPLAEKLVVPQPSPTPFVPEHDDTEFAFGPEWLKSLGATTLNNISPEDSAVSPPTAPLPSEPEHVFSAWTSHAAEPTAFDPWASQMTASTEQAAEQDMLATLESLESGLRSQGFTPLEPSSLAKMRHSATSNDEEQEQPFSSALAQLESLVPAQPVADVTPQPLKEPPAVPKEPLWAAYLEPLPATSQDMPVAPVFSPIPVQLPQKSPVVPPAPVKVLSHPISNAVPEPVRNPVTRTDQLVDNELETTMKRPAIMRAVPQPTSVPRKRPEPWSATGKTVDQEVSYRERLLKGYRYQLAGDYDEAMQEYRMIIRSAPELLSEVVSNVRALLKLVPKYSAGYRVLGDAHMRQGEYLQAMEAYNKALTIAKKAKV